MYANQSILEIQKVQGNVSADKTIQLLQKIDFYLYNFICQVETIPHISSRNSNTIVFQ